MCVATFWNSRKFCLFISEQLAALIPLVHPYNLSIPAIRCIHKARCKNWITTFFSTACALASTVIKLGTLCASFPPYGIKCINYAKLNFFPAIKHIHNRLGRRKEAALYVILGRGIESWFLLFGVMCQYKYFVRAVMASELACVVVFSRTLGFMY